MTTFEMAAVATLSATAIFLIEWVDAGLPSSRRLIVTRERPALRARSCCVIAKESRRVRRATASMTRVTAREVASVLRSWVLSCGTYLL